MDVVASVMEPLGVWWAIAGGWAIDLWLGGRTREHHDVEISIRRNDQERVWDALRTEWKLSCIDPPGSGWKTWERRRRITAPAFQVQASSPALEFDLFLESIVDDVWAFRRDDRVRRPFDVFATSADGVPIVRPEVQLLYMSKSGAPKNEHDFAVTWRTLDDDASAWLRGALALVDPSHPWLDHLPLTRSLVSHPFITVRTDVRSVEFRPIAVGRSRISVRRVRPVARSGVAVRAGTRRDPPSGRRDDREGPRNASPKRAWVRRRAWRPSRGRWACTAVRSVARSRPQPDWSPCPQPILQCGKDACQAGKRN